MTIIASIPIQKHLKNFVSHEIGSDGVLDMTSQGLLACYIEAMLTNKRYLTDKNESYLPAKKYNDKLRIRINSERIVQSRCYLPKTAAKNIDRFLHRLFITQMALYVETMCTTNKVNEKDTIMEFMSRYGIDEDTFPFDTAKKAIYRHKFHRNLSRAL